MGKKNQAGMGFFLSVGFALWCLSGCSQPEPQLSGLKYLSEKPESLRVSRIDVNIQTGQSLEEKRGGVICETRENLLHMMKDWGREAFAASGGARGLKITILDAKVQEEIMPRDKTVAGFFKVEPAERYLAKARVMFELTGGSHTSYARERSVSIAVQAEKAVPENYTLAQRRKLILSLYEELINRLTEESKICISNLLS